MPLLINPKSDALKSILERGKVDYPIEEKRVRDIIARIEKKGDNALFEATRRFDKIRLTIKTVRISQTELKQQATKCPKPLQKAIRQAIENIRLFHQKQLPTGYEIKRHGIRLAQQVLPLDSVGLYIPGGSAPLFSTILMTAIPAQIAGVKRIAAVTPPSHFGLHPAMAYAFSRLGITEVYRLGGAQAIAALALGTASVPRVDKIVGPGNLYVSLAKKILFGRTDIDMIAGPSEICIIADKEAPSAFVARDLLSQAEHGTGRESAVLLTDSPILAEAVVRELNRIVPDTKAAAPLRQALQTYGLIAVLPSLSACADFSNKMAPEHLELMVRQPRLLLKKIKHAGSVFLGDWTCESLGDYFAGPNHVLPTHSTARFFSPLGVYHFIKRMNVTEYDRNAFMASGKAVAAMAEAEGLFFHADAAHIRLYA